MSEEIKNEVSTKEEKEYNERDIAKELTEGAVEDLAAIDNKLDKIIESVDAVYEDGTLNLTSDRYQGGIEEEEGGMS